MTFRLMASAFLWSSGPGKWLQDRPHRQLATVHQFRELKVIPTPETEASALPIESEAGAMKKAVAVKALNGYRIWLRYADGVEGEIDLSHLAGRGVFKAWTDLQVFESVYVDANGAIAWNEVLDLCSDALYLRLTGKTAEELFPALKTSIDA
jgi:hypothetical protein